MKKHLKKFFAVALAAVLAASAATVSVSAVDVGSSGVVAEGGGWDDEWDEEWDEEPGEEPGGGNTNPSAGSYQLNVNGESFSSSKLTISLGSGSATFNPDTNTLTLRNATLDKAKGNYMITSKLPNLTVVLEGENVFNCDSSSDKQIYSDGSLTLTGSGSMTTMRESYTKLEDGEYGYKVVKSDNLIYVNGSLNIENTSLYRLKSDQYDNEIGDITIKNATLTYSELYANGNITVQNSTIQAEQYIGDIYYLDNYNRSQLMQNAIAYRSSGLESGTGFIITDSSILQSYISSTYRKENVNATLKNVRMDFASVSVSGNLTAENLTATCSDRTADSKYFFRTCKLRADGGLSVGGTSNLTYTEMNNGYTNPLPCELKGVRLTDSTLYTCGDLSMTSCTFAGTSIEVDGNFTCRNCTAEATYEDQKSPITCKGEKADFISCNFKGISKTNQGYEQVLLPNGPAKVAYDYYTFSGASINLYSTDGAEQVLNLTDSRMLMDEIRLECTLNVNNTRLQLCTSSVDADKVTINGNVAIVTGGWNTSRRDGLFIDYKGDYYTFDEETGELNLYNDYGVRGWFQIVRDYSNGTMQHVREITDKVTKVVVSDDVSDAQWINGFRDYVNLKEIVFGNTVTMIGGGYPNAIFFGCESLESITIGRNAKFVSSSIAGGALFNDCKQLKEIIIKSEYLIDSADNGVKYWFPINGISTQYTHLTDLRIYVPMSQVEQYREALPEYKDQIIGVDFPPEFERGDVNRDGVVDISDATLVQMSAADLATLDIEQRNLADVNGDKFVDVNDATYIQMFAADLIDKF